jgi:uncharacterized protein YggE
MNLPEQKKAAVWSVIVVVGSLLSLFLLLLSINEIRSFGQPLPDVAATNTITVSGEGDTLAVPDIATFNFSVTETAAAVQDAQSAADTKANAAIKAMTDGGVAAADIQTTAYSINPHYEYTNGVCSPTSGICTQSKSTITGYDVSETVQVKVRDLSTAGTLLAAVGSLGVQNVDSLQFSIDNPDTVQAQARAKAITDAQTKASTLAKQLGVRLVRIVNFSENNGSVPMPVMFASNAMAASGAVAPAPAISTGQQTVTSDVSITYEIR